MGHLLMTLKWFRRFGWEIDVCTGYNNYSRTKKDMFGYTHAVAYHPDGGGVVFVHSTTERRLPARLKKIRAATASDTWLTSAARRIVIVGWKQDDTLLGGWRPTGWELQQGGKTVPFSDADLIVKRTRKLSKKRRDRRATTTGD